MNSNTHKRIMYAIAILVIIPLFILMDPNMIGDGGLKYGAEIVTYIIYLSRVFLLVCLWHVLRVAFITGGYDRKRLSDLINKASETPEGSGYAVIGVAIMSLSISILIAITLLS